jgi:hippurate hydrolase
LAPTWFEYRRGYPPTINSRAEAEFCAQVAAEVCGEGPRASIPSPAWAPRISRTSCRKTRLLHLAGQRAGEGGCTLHNPHYDFNDAAIPFGVAYWVRLAQRWLWVGSG